MQTAIQLSYFLAAVLFIQGLKRMSHPRSARSGIVWAGVGMLVATAATFFYPGLSNLALIVLAMAVGGLAALISGRKVAMTDMPQMIAIYNGFGGGAAAAIAAVELLKHGMHSTGVMTLAVLGAIIGAVSFSGSLVAFGKLQGFMDKVYRLPGHQALNAVLFAATIILGVVLVLGNANPAIVLVFFALSLIVGAMVALPIGGADMPVVISLFNALTGLAVAFEGFVLDNAAMIIAGTVVGAAGTLLTQLMAKAMNRSLANVLFGQFGPSAAGGGATTVEGEMKGMEPQDAAIQMAFASKVIIVPGYGMAVAQAQHKVWEMSKLLMDRGVDVKFAIHPVAGRMPGHMNVLLAEAGIPYDYILDLDEINEDFQNTDTSLVIGANDVINPIARTDKSSPIYGMPILNVDHSKSVLCIKRGRGKGFAGIENPLFYADTTHMVFGDGQKVVSEMINTIKEL